MGVPGGCEAVSHALNGLVASMGDTNSLAFLQVDLKTPLTPSTGPLFFCRLPTSFQSFSGGSSTATVNHPG